MVTYIPLLMPFL